MGPRLQISLDLLWIGDWRCTKCWGKGISCYMAKVRDLLMRHLAVKLCNGWCFLWRLKEFVSKVRLFSSAIIPLYSHLLSSRSGSSSLGWGVFPRVFCASLLQKKDEGGVFLEVCFWVVSGVCKFSQVELPSLTWLSTQKNANQNSTDGLQKIQVIRFGI